jgi:hypothetical protein
MISYENTQQFMVKDQVHRLSKSVVGSAASPTKKNRQLLELKQKVNDNNPQGFEHAT